VRRRRPSLSPGSFHSRLDEHYERSGRECRADALVFPARRCEWFKLLLSPESLRSGVPDPWLPPLPVGKNVVDVIADFLRCAWRYAKRMITEEIGSVVDLSASPLLLLSLLPPLRRPGRA